MHLVKLKIFRTNRIDYLKEHTREPSGTRFTVSSTVPHFGFGLGNPYIRFATVRSYPQEQSDHILQ